MPRLGELPFTEYARTPQNSENPNFDYLFRKNLRLGTPESPGSPLQVSQQSPNTDLSLHFPNSFGSQSTKSCLRNCRQPNYLLTSAQCSLREKKAFFLLERWIEQRPSRSKANSLSAQSFSAAKGVLIASARYGRCHWLRRWKPFCLIESSVKASWFHTSGWYVVNGWLHALKQMHGSTARGRGQVRRSLQSHSFVDVLRAKCESKRSFFIATRDSRRLHFLYSTFKRQARRKPSTPAIRCRPSSSWVDFKTHSLLLFVANPCRLKLNYTHWASKSTRSWLNSFSCFPKPHALFPIPANRAWSSADRSHARSTTWQLVVLVPRSTDTHVAKPMAISRNDIVQ